MKFGAIVMSVFGAVWWMAGIWTSGRGSLLLYSIPLAITALIIIVAARYPADAAMSVEEQRRRGRLFGIASGVEGLFIFATFAVLPNLNAGDFEVPVVAIIVGLHFIPLARWLPVRLYYGSGALLVAFGTAGFWIRNADQRILYVSIAAACVLWVTCLLRLRYGDSRTQP